MNYINSEQDCLTVFILLRFIGFNNQLVTGRTVSHVLCNFVRQNIQVLNTFPSINAKRIAVFFIRVKTFKNRLRKNLSVNQFFQTNLIRNSNITMNNLSIADSVGINPCQQSLFFFSSTEGCCGQTNQL